MAVVNTASPDREAFGRNRVAAKDRAVLEREKACHVEYASRPEAMVARTLPFTVSPRSHEFTERDRNVSSVIR